MKSFEELYNEFKNNREIQTVGEQVSQENAKRKRVTLIICLIVNGLIIAYFIYQKLPLNPIYILFFITPSLFVNLIIMLIITMIFSKERRNFLPIFKEQIIKNMINNFYDKSEYFPNKEMPRNIYGEGKYESYDNYYSDDYVEGKIDDKYLIDMAEVHTEREETYKDSDGNTRTRTYTIFYGIFAKITMDKSINSNLRIASNYSGYGNRLEMDSSEFEKEFNVYASDKIIGMQILTADIMEDILDFKKKTNQKFDIFINEKNIYIRFHCGPMFEPIIRKKQILDEKSLNMYYNILKFVYDLSNKLIKTIEEAEI